jgi:hypothetical protein
VTDTATPETVTAELVPATARTILDYRDTAEQLAEAKHQATLLAEIIETGKLSMRIGRSEHVFFEGWATLGAFNHISVHTVWTKPLEDGRGWEARAEARTVDGRPVGTAEAMCSRDEGNWAKAEDYAIRSMAQTRAGSKALKGPLSWVMTLAGKSPTPAEEVRDDTVAEAPEVPAWARMIPDTEVPVFGDRLQDILAAAGDKSVTDRNDIGEAIWRRCDGIPRIAADMVLWIAGAVASSPTEAPETPPAGAQEANDA